MEGEDRGERESEREKRKTNCWHVPTLDLVGVASGPLSADDEVRSYEYLAQHISKRRGRDVGCLCRREPVRWATPYRAGSQLLTIFRAASVVGKDVHRSSFEWEFLFFLFDVDDHILALFSTFISTA